jgi:flagellar motor protein MotB
MSEFSGGPSGGILGMDLAQMLVEESMRQPTPDIMRAVSDRLERPEREHEPFGTGGGSDVTAGTVVSTPGQHFDIFAREAHPRASGWVVCWSDLMMTMFVMFAALYAFQAPKIQYKSVTELPVQAFGPGEEVRPPVPVESVLERIHDRIRSLIVRDGLGGFLEVRLVPEKAVHVTMSGDFLFGGRDSALRADVADRLANLASILRAAPYGLAVVGHVAPEERLTDFEAAWRLSAARATAVAMFLTGQGGLPAERVSIVGYGDQRPVHGDDGFRRSRRVELVLSTENPTEPLPAADDAGGAGLRQWVSESAQGGR